MKTFLFLVVMTLPVWLQAQNPETAKSILVSAETTALPAQDSLTTKRKILSTSIYRNATRLSSEAIRALYEGNKKARKSYLSGKILTPAGPVISAAGIALGYVAIKGKPASANIHYNQQDITAQYTIRDRTKLAAGVGLFIGGFVLLEFSNDLIVRSTRRFNSELKYLQAADPKPSLHFGITPSGNLGVFARF
nr:hypothetical protein [uncultured Dyadobacter sp.]